MTAFFVGVHMPDWLQAILRSGAVWSALLLVINSLLAYFWPDYPREIWAAVQILIIAILSAVGISDVKIRVRAMRVGSQMNKT